MKGQRMRHLKWFLLGFLCACGSASSGNGAASTDTASDSASVSDAAVDVAADASPVVDTSDVSVAADVSESQDPAMAAIQAQIDALQLDKALKNWRTKVPKPTQVAFTPGRTYTWVLKTDKGDMKLRLLGDLAPMHVTSTVYLTLMGFYDTLTFHRIIKGFMAQGGDPLGTGTGGPKYTYGLEISSASHDSRGVLSMANSGANSEGSQFFITFAPALFLDGKYSVFGKLAEGDAALTAIEAGGTVAEGKPVIVTILSASIEVK